jgi:CRP-like cAMP-binding protein
LCNLASSASTTGVHAGHILFLEGEAGDAAYVVVSGAVDLVLESLEGNQLTLAHVGPGGYFGEMALIDDQPRSATAIAAQESEVAVLSRRNFLNHLQQHPETIVDLLRTLSARVRTADEKIRALGFLDSGGRLAKTLLDLDSPPGKRAMITVTQQQIAAMAGTTRQTASEIIAELRGSGAIVTGRGWVVVTDRDALELLAEM